MIESKAVYSVSDFKVMYVNFFAPLCLYAKNFVADQEEDIVNSVFVKIWNKQIVFETEEHCSNYLYKSVRNMCFDYLESHKSAKHRDAVYLNDIAIDSNVEENIIETEYWASIYREVLKLPALSSVIIRMSYFEGLSNKEIADQLELSIQTVKNRKSSGLKLLRTMLVRLFSFLLSIMLV